MAVKKDTTTKKTTQVKKLKIKLVAKKDSKPSIREAHEFIAGLVRYPFKRIAKGCNTNTLLTKVSDIVKDTYAHANSDTTSMGYFLENIGSMYTRAILRVNFHIRKDMNVLEKFLNGLAPLNAFRGPVSKSVTSFVSALNSDTIDPHIEVATTCSLGNTFLDDNYDRMLLKATLTFIYNLMYAGLDCSDKIALEAYQYLQKFIITDEKKELAR